MAVVRSLQQDDCLAPVLLLVPGNLLRLHVSRLLADELGGHTGIRACTFQDLAREIAGHSFHVERRRSLPDGAERVLYRRAASRLGAGSYFASVREARGLGRLFAATVRALAGAGVDPGHAAELPLRGRLRSKLHDLSTVRTSVRKRLEEAGFYDNAELFERAIARAPAWQAGVPVLLYGFYDLAPAQRRLFEALVSSRPAVAFCPGPHEHEAFAYARETAQYLQDWLGFEAVALEDPPDAPAAGLDMVSAPNAAREVTEVVRAVLAHARAGTPLRKIGVLLRDVETYGEAVVEALEAADVPVYAPGVQTLRRSPAAVVLRTLLEIKREDFPRHLVLELATSGVVAIERIVQLERDAARPEQWERMALRLGIVGTRDEFATRLTAGQQRLRDALEAPERAGGDDAARVRWLRAEQRAMQAFARFFECLDASLAAIPDSGSWTQLSRATARAFEAVIDHEDVEEVSVRLDALAALGALDGEVTLDDFIEAVEDQLAAARSPSTRYERGGVLVTDLMKARGLDLDVIVLPGMVEGGFPRRAAEDCILLDRDRMQINECLTGGPESPLPLKAYGPVGQGAEERLLYHLARHAARKAVVLSYPRVDEITAREWMPSIFLLSELEKRTGKPISLDDLPHLQDLLRWVSSGQIAPTQRTESINALERDLFDVREALRERRADRVAGVLARSPFCRAAIEAEQARWEHPEFTAYDGLLAGVAADEREEAFVPSPWEPLSATRIQMYAACPYRYFLSQVLRLGSYEEPQRLLTLSPAQRGSLFHDVMDRFYREAKERGALPLAPEDAVRHIERALRLTEEALHELEASEAIGPEMLWSASTDELRAMVVDYLERRALVPDADWIPTSFEQPFGWEGERGGPRVEVKLPGGRAVTFRGYIDRIDLSACGTRGRVVDYKTGRYNAQGDNELGGGTALQLPIYLEAAKRLHPDVEHWEAQFDYGTHKGGFKRVRVDSQTVQTKDLAQILDALVESMAAGEFFFNPGGHCTFCEFRETCGAGHEAAHARKSEDPRWRAHIERRQP